MTTNLRSPRRHETWLHLHFREESFNVYSSDIDLADEAWLLVHQLSEVRERGEAHIRFCQPQLRADMVTQVWKEFRAFVRQSEGFYRAAIGLPWKWAPLNYYYAFLNLAKAILTADGVLTAGTFAGMRVRHGLASKAPRTGAGVVDWTVQVREGGVFPRLYTRVMKCKVSKGTDLNVAQLLGYSTPISLQHLESDCGPLRTYPGNCVLLGDSEASWTMIAIPRAAGVADLFPATFLTHYREIQTPKAVALQVFGFHAVASADMQFFESIEVLRKEVSVSAACAALHMAAPRSIFPPVVSSNHQFVLHAPCEATTGPIPMSEMLATYAAVFFLSELVRYHPDVLDDVAEMRDAWLVESFVRSVPSHMLRMMLPVVLNRTVLLDRG
jgi:hypothetical protein